MAGGGIAATNDGWRLVVATVLGVLTLVALAIAQGLLGIRRRARFAAVARESLGSHGARYVAAPVLAIMMIGWFGFNTALAGAGLGRLIGTSARTGVLVFGGLMLIAAWRGLDLLSVAALGAGCATIALAIGGLRLALRDHSGPLLTHGGPPSGNLAILAAIAVIVGYGAAFSLRTPDFTADLAHERDVVLCGALGLGVPLLAFLLAGAVLEVTTGTWNLVEVLERVGSPTIAYAFVALGFTGSVLSNLHSGAVALEEFVSQLSHRGGLIITAVLGTVLAVVDYSDRMIPFLTTMALAAPCLIAVLWVDQRRGNRTLLTVRPIALAAWGFGAVIGALTAAFSRPLALPAGLLVAGLIVVVGSRPARPQPTT